MPGVIETVGMHASLYVKEPSAHIFGIPSFSIQGQPKAGSPTTEATVWWNPLAMQSCLGIANGHEASSQ